MNTRIDTNHYEATSQNVNALLARHSHWLLRAGFASVFLFHGVEKFVMGIGGFAAMMNLPVTVAFLVAMAEVLAGVGIIVGATVRNRLGDIVTRLAGLAAAPVLVGAIAMVHWGQWSFVASDSHPMGGMEFQVVLLLLALSFILRGNQS
ncbi:DoxX [Ectothiorhodospira haloalkaliphila]|uniref:DoxX n=1 Tax=Ectothiorhodospira haloalkaliphila TaxID=421628 RepID=W8KFW4_9GAMM|nr:MULTISPECIES: DoxX family protein [Ectothiorhodospira]AHK78639.1 DoxX [Ectothiorhodospira haloalkaliphila]MCG5495490.1 DoxX family protein [Ectothiorhodospira variabilis]MCG5498919.1 DoxX family protein [Ectothiorhodospira variabilis]MCG5503901.1 DoxX family protein [Ectothiorhodospira variabilis]MCG5506968.1 DoxX family protein [Ectothiorhodospira variabilis]